MTILTNHPRSVKVLIHIRLSVFTEVSPPPITRAAEHAVPELKVILMQKLTWLVIISYTLLLFKPVLPIFMDALAHTFWEQQHLMTVHEEHGKFHVHYELNKAARHSEKDKEATGNKFETAEYIPATIKISVARQQYFTRQDQYRFFSCYYPFPSFDVGAQPPKASV